MDEVSVLFNTIITWNILGNLLLPECRQRELRKPETQINSEGFLAEVFHPWVRWEGPGSRFENSSGAGAGAVWKSRI